MGYAYIAGNVGPKTVAERGFKGKPWFKRKAYLMAIRPRRYCAGHLLVSNELCLCAQRPKHEHETSKQAIG
ncbi:hypothetical protein KHS38_18850 [Mucilaginibacter sp. Bleaf8]|uniref:hypothetical protein n=1 Tax=Mucilaginibacter sp. Bleaf8 TaxID=2834430 RepID=UPI001BCBFB1C|nr:hypothetical protein [Mucilaginibacter sp. Bleaf8]MBS7566471.1 hypothetical protein [Mucilaginibacter sp. Bleaf8]